MTSEDLNKLPFKCVLHLSMCHEHTTSYIAETPFFKLEACVHVPFKDGEPCGKLYTHYLLNGKVYKSKKKLLEEINSRNLTREIKFRAKDKFTGQWRYGDLVHNQRVTTTGLEPRVMVSGYEVLENTVGQYTGLKDKNGKEIEMAGEISLFEENYYTNEEQEYVIETICKSIEDEGYSVQPVIIPACAVGAPHRRDRVWFIANSKCIRSDKIYNKIESEKSNGDESYRKSYEWITSDANIICSKRELFKQQKKTKFIRQNSGNIQTG